MEKKQKRINIYIDMKDKKRLDDLKYKYHLSYSTIINIIAKHLALTNDKKMILAGNKYSNMATLCQEIYIYPKGNKTSIKPKDYINGTDVIVTKPSLFYTNITRIFLKDDLKKFIENQKERETKLNSIYAELQNTYEENWDGNRFQRIMPKIIKQNRNYYKRILEDE